MARRRFIAACVAASFLVIGCDEDTPVDTPRENAVTEAGAPDIQPGPARSEPGLTGGFVGADASTPGADIAYDMAIDAIYDAYPSRATVISTTLEVQVVAGLNYQFVITRSGPEETRDVFAVRIYRDLQDAYSVTRVEKVQ